MQGDGSIVPQNQSFIYRHSNYEKDLVEQSRLKKEI
jgi:hypothetical protein